MKAFVERRPGLVMKCGRADLVRSTSLRQSLRQVLFISYLEALFPQYSLQPQVADV
jgi:hypothetical protein